jgi:hypothetical protein
MTTEDYRPPRILAIGIGIALFVILLGAVCSLSQGIKWAGSVLLIIPERLGLVRTVKPAEVFRFDMTQTPARVRFPTAGDYQVYTSDYDLLVISDTLAQADEPPWLTVTSAGDGSAVSLSHISRGLLPYDTPHAPGRPVIEVGIPEPGEYLLDYPTRPAEISLVPDYVTGKEAVIYAAFAVQILIAATPFAILLYRREQRLLRRLRDARGQSTRRFEKIRRVARDADAQRRGDDGSAPVA